jgi:phage shock protein PspC (stress-responsive transcriptional regulator)
MTTTTRDRLEVLLQEGRISRGEYDELCAGLAAEDAGAPMRPPMVQAGWLWRKSWRHRQVGGVCGGLAEMFGINPWWPRLAFVLAALAAMKPVIITYLLLYIVLPWSRDKVPSEEELPRVPWLFAGGMLLMMGIGYGLTAYTMSWCQEMYVNLNETFPWLMRQAFKLHRAFDPVMQGLVLLGVIVFYGTLPAQKKRAFGFAVVAAYCAYVALMFGAMSLAVLKLR